MPNMYARGILFGKMVIELGDTCTAKNEREGLIADIEFKTKVVFAIFRICLILSRTTGLFLRDIQCTGGPDTKGKYRCGGNRRQVDSCYGFQILKGKRIQYSPNH